MKTILFLYLIGLTYFTFQFEGKGNDANIHFGWGNTVVTVPVKG